MGCECSTAEKIPEIPRRSQNESILANAHWVITAINGLRDGGVDNATNKTYELLSRDAKLQVLKDLEQSIARQGDQMLPDEKAQFATKMDKIAQEAREDEARRAKAYQDRVDRMRPHGF